MDFDDDDNPSQFEEELALLDEIEAECHGDDPEVMDTDAPGPVDDATDFNAKWARPPLPSLDPKKDSVAFQQLELDYYIGWFIDLFSFFRLLKKVIKG